MMEAILRNELKKLGVEARVESAGVLKEAEGQLAFESSLKELANRGITLEGHKSRHIGSIGDLTRFDNIICVGEEEAQIVRDFCPAVADRVQVANAESGGIPNPWQLGPEAYRTCAVTIEASMAEIARTVNR